MRPIMMGSQASHAASGQANPSETGSYPRCPEEPFPQEPDSLPPFFSLSPHTKQWRFQDASAWPNQARILSSSNCRGQTTQELADFSRTISQRLIPVSVTVWHSLTCFRARLAMVTGIEVDAHRAEQAKAWGIETLQANTMDVRCQLETVSLLYLNPPYDGEAGESNNQRLEFCFP